MGARASSTRRGPRIRVPAALFLAWVLLAVPATSGMQGTLEFQTRQRLATVQQFCFDAGKAEMGILVNPAENGGDEQFEPSLLICKEREYQNLQSEQPLACDLTRFANMAAAGCVEHPVAVAKRTTILQSNIRGRRYFVLRICPVNISVAYTAAITYRFLNQEMDPVTNGRGYNHLTCEEMGLPQVYLFLACIWSLTLGLWVGSWLWQRHYAVLLHKIMSAVPLAQIVHCFTEHFLWGLISRTGQGHRELWVVLRILAAFNKGIFYTALLSLAKGWLVLRWDVSLTERRTLIFCMSWVIMAFFTFDLFSGLFLFMLVFVVMIVLRLVFTAINYNYQVLHVQTSIMQDLHRPLVEIRTSQELMKIYGSFRAAMGLYLFLVITLQVVDAFVLNDRLQYVYVAATEALDWALVVGVGFFFRSRGAVAVTAADEEEEEARVNNARDAAEAEGGARRSGVEGSGAGKVVLVIHPSASGSISSGFARVVTGSYEHPSTFDEVLKRASIGLHASATRPSRGGEEQQGLGGVDGGNNGALSSQGAAHRAGALPARMDIALVDIPGGGGPGGEDGGLGESWSREVDGLEASVGVRLEHVIQPVCISLTPQPASAQESSDASAITLRIDAGSDDLGVNAPVGAAHRDAHGEQGRGQENLMERGRFGCLQITALVIT